MLLRIIVVVVIGVSAISVDVKEFLLIYSAKPIISHVPGLKFLLVDVIMDEESGSCIVGFNGSGWLQMPYFVEGVPNRNGNLCVMKEACGF